MFIKGLYVTNFLKLYNKLIKIIFNLLKINTYCKEMNDKINDTLT